MSFSIMARCVLRESDSPESEFQFHHWLIVRCQVGYFTSLCPRLLIIKCLIAVSTSQTMKIIPVNHVGVRTK